MAVNGICQCGCGGETKPATMTNKKYGWVKGQPNKFIKGHNRPWLGKKRAPFSEEYKEKQRDAHIGKKYQMSDIGRESLRKNMKKAQHESLSRRQITPLELTFQQIIDENKLPYKYSGNGTFIIDGLNPDFININGEKIAVEVFSRYYKEKDFGSIEKYKSKRSERLAAFGWKVYYFEQPQITQEIVLSVLGGDSH